MDLGSENECTKSRDGSRSSEGKMRVGRKQTGSLYIREIQEESKFSSPRGRQRDIRQPDTHAPFWRRRRSARGREMGV